MDWADKICAMQAEWLKIHRRAAVDHRGYAADVTENLYGFSAEARDEYRNANGNEIGTAARPGKLAAPWSSSALVVNVFDDWRGRDLRPLITALGCDRKFSHLRFEAKFPTGFRSGKANIDVVLEGSPCLAIESKLCEPFEGGTRGKRRNSISSAYVEDGNVARWQGLNALRQLAREIYDRQREFRRVDAPQLIKHTIALTRAKRPFELLHLWFNPGDAAGAQEVAKELRDLGDAMQRDGVRFRSLTYQELFHRLKGEVLVGSPYIAYLQSRYFQDGKVVGVP